MTNFKMQHGRRVWKEELPSALFIPTFLCEEFLAFSGNQSTPSSFMK